MKETSTSLTVPQTFNIANAELNKANLIAMKDEDTKLLIKGIDDKAGIKAATALRAKYRTFRTALEKHRQSLSKPVNKYLKDLKKATDDLGAEAEKAELFFDEQLKAVEAEKERVKNEALLAEQKRIQSRSNQLYKLGATFDSEMFTLPYDEGVGADLADLKDLNENEWEALYNLFNVAYVTEQNRLTAERLEREQAENDLLAAQELARQQAAHNLAKRTKLREKELKMLGGVINEIGDYEFHEKNFYMVTAYCIETTPDGIWGSMIAELETTETVLELAAPIEVKLPVDYVEMKNVVAIDANNIVHRITEPPDYSLNEYEKAIAAHGKMSAKVKDAILLSIAEYKALMDKM